MRTESIWITGASGKLGNALIPILKEHKEYKIIATDKDVDISDLQSVKQASDWYRPTIIINLAGITDFHYCEKHEVEAYKINTLGARNLATAARKHNAKLIHFSTDDVFCGINTRAKNEFDVPTPDNVFGKSKYAGEQLVRELCPKHLIVRSSWVYGDGGSKDYLHKVIEKAQAGEHFKAEVDHVSTPTSVTAIAKFIEKLIETEEYGIYHASDEGMCTRFQYATAVLSLAGFDPSFVTPSFSKDGNGISTILDNLMLKMTGIYEMPDWEADLKQYMIAHKFTEK